MYKKFVNYKFNKLNLNYNKKYKIEKILINKINIKLN